MPEAFDSETCDLMSRALEHAWKQIDGAAPPAGSRADSARAILTKAIIAAVEEGERDEYKLAAQAVSHFQQSTQ